MNLLNKLTLKNLKLNKKRTIVTIIGIMLSVALITAVSSIYASFIDSLIIFETREKGNFHVAFYNVPVNDLDVFKNNRKIDDYFLTEDIGYAKINSRNENKPYVFLKAFSKNSLANLSIKLVEGRLPENSNEIIIPTHLKTNGRVELHVGDTITLDIGKRVTKDGTILNQDNPFILNEDYIDIEDSTYQSEKIIDTTSKQYKIVGIIERPAYNIEPYTAPGYTFITYTSLDDMKGEVSVYAKYNKQGVKDAFKLTANIISVDEELFNKVLTSDYVSHEIVEKYDQEMANAKYKININDYLISLETNPISNSSIGGLGIVVIIVILIIIFTSIFCIKNSFDISITEKIKQYGMLRSIGATKKQIRKNVFYEASILGLIGIPIGILCGLFASYILIIISNYFLNGMIAEGIKLQFSFSLYAIIIAIVLGIITIYFSAFKSARRASKVSPIDSIRNSANITLKSNKLKTSKLISKIFGVGGEISYKNLKRNKKKYRTTTISIVVSVAVFIALFGFMNMAFATVKSYLNISEYNLVINATLEEGNMAKFIDTTKLDNIEDFTILRQTYFEIKNPIINKEYIDFMELNPDELIDTFQLDMYVLGNSQYQKYLDSLNLSYEDMKDKAILYDYLSLKKTDAKDKIHEKYTRFFAYEIGDELKANLPSQEYTLPIGYITSEKPFGLKDINHEFIIISDELFDSLVKTNNLEIYYKATDANKLQDEIDLMLQGENYYIDNISENVKMMNNLFILIGIFLYGFIIVISLIGITNIFNTITTSMDLRRQEFAMLKSVGMTTKEFNRMIRLESLFIGLRALCFGIPIGVILSYIIYYFLRDESMVYELPIMAIFIATLVVFILIMLIMKYSIKKINKQNTIETIRNENI